ncbi:hypothetical protein pb186bvf_018480 [Paramecium bursaria]
MIFNKHRQSNKQNITYSSMKICEYFRKYQDIIQITSQQLIMSEKRL